MKNALSLLILLVGFVLGLLLARLCKEEIKLWRKRLFILSLISLVLIVLIVFIPVSLFDYKFPVILSLFFIIITFLTIAWKSY